MPLLDGPSLGGNARHVLRQYAEESSLARGRAANAAGTEEFGGGCLRGRYNNLREVIQNNPSLVVVPSIINAGSLFVQRPICRTNYLPNNSMAGATGGVLPTNWSIASLPAGITVSYSASGTAVAADGTSVNYIDVTVSGTAGASGFLNIRPNPSPSTIAAFVGQSWNTSVYLQLISGSVASISPTWQLQELNSSQTFLQGSNIGGLGSLVVGGQFDRYNVSRVLTDSATAFVTCRWGHSFVSGTTYSYTLRIGSPQLERFSVPTPMIATSTGAVTRLNESTNVVGLPPDFTVSRNTTATRVNSSGLIESVASGVPRIDWLGQSCPGLLVEPSGQNQMLQSQNLSLAFPSQANTTPSADVSISPDGTQNADRLTFLTTGGYRLRNFSIVSGTSYTATLFYKNVDFTTGNIFSFQVSDGVVAAMRVNINPVTNTITQATGPFTNVSSSIENYGNGWYRVRISGTASNTGGGWYELVTNAAKSIDLWGFQFETGLVATSYIPTTAAAVSRAADVISASGALVSGLIGQTEGTIYAEVDVRALGAAKNIMQIDEGASTNRIGLFVDISPTRLTLLMSNGGVTNSISGSLTTGITKIAASYASGNVQVFTNGSFLVSGTIATYPTATLNSISVGSRISSGVYGIQLNDRIRSAALYTTRLTDAQLAELTRL